MATAGDLGLDLTPDGIAAMDRLNELEDVTIEVGYQADQKAADGETSLAEIAYWNHYGTVHKDGSVMIPARPFMDTIKKHSEELSEFSQQALSSLDTADAVANAIGSQAKSMIQEAIKGEEWTPNAPITVEGGWMINEYGKKGPVPVYVEGKGSTKPLIDTGFMRQNCQYVIVKGKKLTFLSRCTLCAVTRVQAGGMVPPRQPIRMYSFRLMCRQKHAGIRMIQVVVRQRAF